MSPVPLPGFSIRTGFAAAGCFLLFLLLDTLCPLPPLRPCSKVVFARDSTLLAAYLSPDDKWRMPVHLEELSPDLIHAVLVKEDQGFRWHFGINPFSLVHALFNNLLSRQRTSGASTISMQVARMLSPAERTYGNKGIEMFRAVQLEWHYTKKQILELYFTLLPYGGNIEGVKAASLIYFDRNPGNLSMAQSILLAVIPNRPNSLRLDRELSIAKTVRDKWIRKFMREEIFGKKKLQEALEEPVEAKRHTLIAHAPHFSYRMTQYSMQTETFTLLEPRLQHISENLLQHYVQRVQAIGVTNGAVLVVDNRTHAVVAYCGSSDFNNEITEGQINGITALRSPGSALKPTLYALALDQGLITPKMKMLDVPSDFSGYVPENFDRTFHGEVTVESALMNSLNIPAVRLVKQAGLNPYLDLLSDAGFKDIRERKKRWDYP